MATVALAGVVGAAPIAQAGTSEDTKTTTPSMPIVTADVLTCIAGQLPTVETQVTASRVCRQWHAAMKEPIAQSLRVVHTQKQLEAVFTDSNVAAIVLIPHESLTIAAAPANSLAHITIFDTQLSSSRHTVFINADIRATASGTALIEAKGESRLTASGNTRVHASGSSQVIASGNTNVFAYDSAQVTASDTTRVYVQHSPTVIASNQAKVIVASSTSKVVGQGSSVRILATPHTRVAVRVDDDRTLEIHSWDELYRVHLLEMKVDPVAKKETSCTIQ
ncbi:MAG: hypothetical protein H0T78_05090 [Longispora sp.]|nr:hypothetical protein [Longispora sp. (in: high G+C Gram-positive bacteria)]